MEAAIRSFRLEALTNRQRKDKGKQLLPEMLEHFIEGLALQNLPLSTAMIHRMARAASRKGTRGTVFPYGQPNAAAAPAGLCSGRTTEGRAAT
jgi:hypothetical protein